MNYAVIFTYSFDNDCPVFLFETEEEAKKFLRKSYEEEVRIDTEENGWDCHGYIEDDGWFAKIFNCFTDRTDVTEFRIGKIYQ